MHSTAHRMSAATVLLLTAGLLLSLLTVGPTAAIDEGPATDPATPIGESVSGRYIVVLDDAPLAAYGGGISGLAATDVTVTGADQLDTSTSTSQAYLAHLGTRQDAAESAIAAAIGRSPNVVFSYDTALNGLAIELSAAEAAQVAGVAGIERVIADTELQLVTDAGPQWIGAPSVWDGSASGGTGTRGEGLVAGIIDTGVNHDHPSFAEVGGDGYVHANPKGTYFGACDPLTGLPFCNDKLIGVWDFTGTTPLDDNGHGSHTASTTAGNVVTAALEAPTITVERPISGVAPHANLITYKACVSSPAIGACLQTSTVAAIDQAVADGVDVINFSIGGTSRDPYGDGNALAFLNAQRAGVFLAVSAGNSGPGASTVGSPADAPWVTAVGASTHNRAFVNSLIDMTGGTGAPADVVGASVTSAYGPAPIVYAGDHGSALCGEGPAAPTGEAAINPFPPGTFDGEIVLCDRGTYGRVEKAQNVMEGGAGGFVLANDEPSGNSLVADAYPIPGVGISYDDGLVVKAWLADGSGHTASIAGTTADESATNGDIMASFSSRGPNPYSGDVLKPNVTAPGVDILAAFHTPLTDPTGNPEYGVISGTSMSGPHTAGAAVLLRALHPDWTPDEVRSALMTTGVTEGVRKEDGTSAADPFDYGGGRVALGSAAAAGLLFNETADNYAAANPEAGGDLTTLNIPALSDGECAGACSWTRTVKASANGAGTWTASVTAPEGMALAVEPASFSIAAGETASFKVSADVTGLTAGDWALGAITFTSSGGAPPAQLPVAVLAGAGGAVGEAPVLDDPGDVNTTGSYDLTWSDVVDEAGYVVQESTDYAVAFTDDAESGMAGKWTTETLPGGWLESELRSSSPTTSYTSLNTDEKTSTLTMVEPISVPAGADATINFASYEDTEPDFDYGYVEASNDGGSTWETLLTVNGLSGGFVDRSGTASGLSGNVLFRFRYVTDELISAPLYEGWYVDDIEIVVATWSDIGETDADVTTLAVTDQPSGTYFHRVAGLYDTGATEPVTGPWSNVVDITVDAPAAQADLAVTDIVASRSRPRASEPATITATVANSGDGAAAASSTEFVLDGTTVLGVVDTPAIPAGGSVQVSVEWDTRGQNGDHVITATADSTGAVDESDETNNSASLTVTVRGNKIRNGSFEQANAGGTGPEAWTADDTAAGQTSWTDGGSHGDHSATITGTGGNAVLSGVASWTSAPVAVTAGELLTVTASVSVAGASSAPTVGLAYLGPTGELLSTVTALTAPLTTDGFQLLEESVSVPIGVTEVQLVLLGSSAADLSTTGSVTFDDVGLFSE